MEVLPKIFSSTLCFRIHNIHIHGIFFGVGGHIFDLEY